MFRETKTMVEQCSGTKWYQNYISRPEQSLQIFRISRTRCSTGPGLACRTLQGWAVGKNVPYYRPLGLHEYSTDSQTQTYTCVYIRYMYVQILQSEQTENWKHFIYKAVTWTRTDKKNWGSTHTENIIWKSPCTGSEATPAKHKYKVLQDTCVPLSTPSFVIMGVTMALGILWV